MNVRLHGERALLIVSGSLLVVFLALPVVALFVTSSWHDFVSGLQHRLVWPALRLSLLTTCASLAITVLFGTPLAYCLAQTPTRLGRFVETLLQLPIVIPPAVAGLALLLAFGRHGLLGELVHAGGHALSFSSAAVVMAQVFVATPFFVQSAVSAFRRLDPNLALVARSFGALPVRVFVRVALPLAAPGLLAGAGLSWARALGEFGATLMFAGNLEGVTQTLPLAVYVALESDLRAAQALSLLLVLVAFALLIALRGALPAFQPGRRAP